MADHRIVRLVGGPTTASATSDLPLSPSTFDGRTCTSLDDTDAAEHLGAIPDTERGRELWYQNAAGYILHRDAGLYAVRQLDPSLSPDARAAALKAIDDTLYGVCMIADGVTGAISTREGHTSVSIHVNHEPAERTPARRR
jgi:hypothetical protein